MPALELAWWRTREGPVADAVLVHGTGGSNEDFPGSLDDELAALGLGVVRLDLRDAGRSPHLDELGIPPVFDVLAGRREQAPYTLVDMAEDVVGVLDAGGIERAVVVGVSLGGMVAQQVALAAPDRVAGLVLVASSSSPEVADLVDPAALEHALGGGAATEVLDRAQGAPTLARAVRQLMAIVATDPWLDRLAALEVPCLLGHGAADRVLRPVGAVRTWGALRHARAVLLAGVEHGWSDAVLPQMRPHLAWLVEQVR
jgi:pimeloyl-ACP methyl ester carboxylesterase